MQSDSVLTCSSVVAFVAKLPRPTQNAEYAAPELLHVAVGCTYVAVTSENVSGASSALRLRSLAWSLIAYPAQFELIDGVTSRRLPQRRPEPTQPERSKGHEGDEELHPLGAKHHQLSTT